MDAPLLHEEIDKVFLLLANLSEVVKIVPYIKVEVILDTGKHGILSSVSDVVICARVVCFTIRNAYGHLILLLSWGHYSVRLRNSCTLQQFALYRATN